MLGQTELGSGARLVRRRLTAMATIAGDEEEEEEEKVKPTVLGLSQVLPYNPGTTWP
jgi:hypothetical protein